MQTQECSPLIGEELQIIAGMDLAAEFVSKHTERASSLKTPVWGLILYFTLLYTAFFI